MIELGIEKLKKIIYVYEKKFEKKFGPSTETHDVIVGLLFSMLLIKMHFQGDLIRLLSSIKSQYKNLERTIVLAAIILVILQHNDIIKLSFIHAIFAMFFHLISDSHNIANIFWFSLIAMYYFNSTDIGE